MKNKTFLALFLVAAMSLGMTGLSFARGSGMGGGMRAGGGPAGGGFGGQGAFHSSRQGMGEMAGGHVRQDRVRNREGLQYRGGERDQDRSRDGGVGGPAAGIPQDQDVSQGADNGNRYGQQGVGTDVQADGQGATPATPAQPGEPGDGATPATPAIPPEN